MKHLLIVLLLSFLFISMNAQTPFSMSNKVVEKTETEIQATIDLKKRKGRDLKVYESNFDVEKNHVKAKGTNELVKEHNDRILEEAEKPDVADKLSTGIVISGEVEKLFPTLVGNVVTYRLKLWERTLKAGDDKDKKATVFLPLSFISKLSGSNEDNSGTVNDAVSYFGAPVTLRLSPNLLDVKKGDARWVIGMHHDLRALPIGDTLTDKVEVGFGYYGALGVSFFSIGDVYDDEADAWIPGKWSLSALFYTFRSGGKFKQAIFGNYEKSSITGFECMLRFNTGDDSKSKFNFFLGTNYGLTKNAPNYQRWDFRIGLGN